MLERGGLNRLLLFSIDLTVNKRHSVNDIRDTIGRLATFQDKEHPGIPCNSGCSKCCREEVWVSSNERMLIRRALRSFEAGLWQQVYENAANRDGVCPFLVQDLFGCSLHETGVKPLVCQVTGRATWDITSNGSQRSTIGCDAVDRFWAEQDRSIQQQMGADCCLMPMGMGIYDVILKQTALDPGGTLRQIVLATPR